MTKEELGIENKQLKDTLNVFFKVVIVNGKQYMPGYPLCAGCPNLIIGRGWECWYRRHTTECEYPDELVLAALKGKNENN